MVCLLSSCGGRSFITDASYRQRVEQDFNQKKERLPQGDLFAIFDADLTPYEREVTGVLYALYALADITRLPRRISSDECASLSEGGRGNALGRNGARGGVPSFRASGAGEQ